MKNRVSIYEYLAFLSVKHQIDPTRFFEALLSAEKNGEAGCGGLLFKCRSNEPNRVMMLIMKGSNVVAQFPLTRGFLVSQVNPISTSVGGYLGSKPAVRRASVPLSPHIGDLRHGMKNISLKARVSEVSEARQVYTRFGNYATVCNALLEDGSGTIKMCLWNEQIRSVAVGDMVEIEGARIARFRGENQLKMGRKGKLTVMSQTWPAVSVQNSHAEPT
jgi:replication factor A1